MNTAATLRHVLRTHAPALPIEVRGVDAFPQIMHAKIVVRDGVEAFLIGSPFVNGYWDDGAHRPTDPLRSDDDLAGRPIHDLSVRLTGPVVADLVAWFDALWAATPSRPGPAVRLPGPARGAGATPDAAPAVRLLRTLPAKLMPAQPEGTTEILDAYLAAIRSARTLLYLENQYFSARPIRQAVVEALAAHPELEVILVLNQNPDITAYRAWQVRRLAEGGLLDHPRVGVFGLWSAAPGRRPPHRPDLTQLFIHSKVGVVDDRWATLGTANLDGVSLYSYGDDFSGRLGRGLFRGVRNVDLNVALSDAAGRHGAGPPPAPLGAPPGRLRRRPRGPSGRGLASALAGRRCAARRRPRRRTRAGRACAAVRAGGASARPASRARHRPGGGRARAALRPELGGSALQPRLARQGDPRARPHEVPPGAPGLCCPLPPMIAHSVAFPAAMAVIAGVAVVAEQVREAFRAHVAAPSFSCLGARAALRHDARIEVYGALGTRRRHRRPRARPRRVCRRAARPGVLDVRGRVRRARRRRAKRPSSTPCGRSCRRSTRPTRRRAGTPL